MAMVFLIGGHAARRVRCHTHCRPDPLGPGASHKFVCSTADLVGDLPRGVRRQLGDRALAKRRQNPLANTPERIAHVTLRKLLALAVVGRRTGGHRHRAVDRLNHVGDRNLPRRPRQLIAAARALVRRQQPALHQPLQHLRHQLNRNVVLLGDLASARRSPIAAQGQMLHGHQRVIRLFRKPQHMDAVEIRPPWSEFSTGRPDVGRLGRWAGRAGSAGYPRCHCRHRPAACPACPTCPTCPPAPSVSTWAASDRPCRSSRESHPSGSARV